MDVKEEMWKKDIKKAAMLAVGLGGALALYISRQKINYLTQTFLYLNRHVWIFEHLFRGTVKVETKEVAEGVRHLTPMNKLK